MCDPLTIAGVGLTLGSTLLSSARANKIEDARNRAIIAEGNRQSELQKRAIANLQDTQKDFTPERQSQGIEQAAQERAERLTRNVEGGGDADANDVPLTGSAPRVVRETAAKEINSGISEGRDFAKRLARLGAFGENQFNNQIGLGRLGETLGQIGSESANSANILPLELDSANREGDDLFLASDIAASLGSVANRGGAVGVNPFPATGESVFPDFLRPLPPLPGRKPPVPGTI